MPRKILLHSLLICLCLADPARAQGKPSDAVRQITAQQQQKAVDAAGRERRAGADDAEARLETLRAAAASRAAAFKVADWKGEELYALGVLHADQRHEVEAARSVFRETWPYAAAAVRP